MHGRSLCTVAGEASSERRERTSWTQLTLARSERLLSRAPSSLAAHSIRKASCGRFALALKDLCTGPESDQSRATQAPLWFGLVGAHKLASGGETQLALAPRSGCQRSQAARQKVCLQFERSFCSGRLRILQVSRKLRVGRPAVKRSEKVAASRVHCGSRRRRCSRCSCSHRSPCRCCCCCRRRRCTSPLLTRLQLQIAICNLLAGLLALCYLRLANHLRVLIRFSLNATTHSSAHLLGGRADTLPPLMGAAPPETGLPAIANRCRRGGPTALGVVQRCSASGQPGVSRCTGAAVVHQPKVAVHSAAMTTITTATATATTIRLRRQQRPSG